MYLISSFQWCTVYWPEMHSFTSGGGGGGRKKTFFKDFLSISRIGVFSYFLWMNSTVIVIEDSPNFLKVLCTSYMEFVWLVFFLESILSLILDIVLYALRNSVSL